MSGQNTTKSEKVKTAQQALVHGTSGINTTENLLNIQDVIGNDPTLLYHDIMLTVTGSWKVSIQDAIGMI